MKIKRYFAADMRDALRMVKEELGPDAVILSNARADNGVEVVAAMDYDENVIQQAIEKKDLALDAQLDEKLKVDTLSIDWKEPPKQSFREEYTPVKKTAKKSIAKKAVKPSRPINKPEWFEDPAIKAVKQELEYLRRDFRTQLNELSWADKIQQNPVRIDVIRRLLDTGFSKKLSLKLAETCVSEGALEEAWHKCLKVTSLCIPVLEDKLLDEGGVVALYGPTGVGKTTTIAKIAARFRMRYGAEQLALITTDNYRIGAHEQLSNFAKILGVPMRVASTQDDLDDALSDFIDKKLVLIDTAGMSQRDLRVTEQMQLLRDDKFDIESYLVISATTESRAMREIFKTFNDANPKGCILTKLDETDCPGSALSAIIENQIPLCFVTDGQRVPEDLHYANAEQLMAKFAEPSQLLDESDIALSVLIGEQTQYAHI
ncbi:MAG: flagellar biosynthesis protein FlhF [Piscirickettsiaceae bacterium]|nr:MAG: flagellar biosynthesis protein FlhF [Piscirickettsiaceae bacterium]